MRVITDEDIKPKIPKEFHWLLQLKKLAQKGYVFKFCYFVNGKLEECDRLKYFEVDSEGQSYVPIRPDVVKVFDYKVGEGFVEVARFVDRKGLLDPDVDTATRIFDLATQL